MKKTLTLLGIGISCIIGYVVMNTYAEENLPLLDTGSQEVSLVGNSNLISGEEDEASNSGLINDKEKATVLSKGTEGDMVSNKETSPSTGDSARGDENISDEQLTIATCEIEQELKDKLLAVIAKKLNVDLEKDGAFYAREAGITKEYRGDRRQNEKLREYFIAHACDLPEPAVEEKDSIEVKKENQEKSGTHSIELSKDGGEPKAELVKKEEKLLMRSPLRTPPLREGGDSGSGISTPESCFEFSNGVITKYKKDSAPECGAEVIIPATIGGEAVTSIGAKAFHYNQLTSVTIPNSVTSIGDYAFNNNQLPDDQAFIYARNADGSQDLTKVVSYGGKKRDNVIIPDSVTSIGNGAFSSNQLTSVIIPDSVTSIGDWAFEDNGLTSVTIPNSVTSIGEAAFPYNQLTSITIGNSVTSIGVHAFLSNQLTSVIIPDSVTFIGERAFAENPGKAELSGKVEGLIQKDPSEVTVASNANIQLVRHTPSTPESCFEFSNGVITKYKKGSAPECGVEVIIPATIGGEAVTSIGAKAFRRDKLTSVTIPDSVISIGEEAFAENQLTSVTIPDSVTSIGARAFHGNQLTSVTIPNSVTSIGNSAFSYNKLTSVIIPDGVASIGHRAFAGNEINTLSLPNSLTTIGESAFNGNLLTGVTIPNALANIGYAAFAENIGDPSLGGKSCPNYARSICSYVRLFTDNTKITEENFDNAFLRKSPKESDDGTTPEFCFDFRNGKIIDYYKDKRPQCGAEVIIPEQIDGIAVTEIGDSAFASKGITSVAFPSSLTEIGMKSFFGNNLTSLTLPEGVIDIWDSAFEDNQLTSVKIPESVRIIGYEAFYNNQLISVVIPEGVTDIGDYAFRNNQLTSVTIPSSVEMIGYGAFVENPGNPILGEIDCSSPYNPIFRAPTEPEVCSESYVELVTTNTQIGENDFNHARLKRGIYFIVTFDANGGTSVNPLKVFSGTKVTQPDNPLKTGHTFIGWYLTGEKENFDFENTPVTQDIILYAKWMEQLPLCKDPAVILACVLDTDACPDECRQYTVTFNTDGGTIISPLRIFSGSTATQPDNPLKTGFTFSGWKVDGATQLFDFSTPITGDITLIAQWKKENGGGSSGGTGTTTGTVTPQPIPSIGGGYIHNPDTPESFYDNTDQQEHHSAVSKEKEVQVNNGKAKEITELPENTLTRGVLARFVSTYLEANPELKAQKKIINTDCQSYADQASFTADELKATKEVCELGIMGIHDKTKKPLDNFEATRPVPMSEFTTVLSRLVYQYDYDNLGDGEYYLTHYIEMLNRQFIEKNKTIDGFQSYKGATDSFLKLQDKKRSDNRIDQKKESKESDFEKHSSTVSLTFNEESDNIINQMSEHPLTRGELAVFILTFLEAHPELKAKKAIINTDCQSYDDQASFTVDELKATKEVCELGIMGIHDKTKKPLDNFEATRPVPMSEFTTVLSRLIYQYRYDNLGDGEYYLTHYVEMLNEELVQKNKAIDGFQTYKGAGKALLKIQEKNK